MPATFHCCYWSKIAFSDLRMVFDVVPWTDGSEQFTTKRDVD